MNRTVLIISSEADEIQSIRSSLGKEYRVESAPGMDAALDQLRNKHVDLVYADIHLLTSASADVGDPDFLGPFLRLRPPPEIIVMTPPSRIRQAVKILKAGASEYITLPVVPDEVRLVAESAEQTLIENYERMYLRDQFWRREAQDLVHTHNIAMHKVFEKVRSVAKTKAIVLLCGETGTGKGVMAKLIHMHSNRGDAQFISVHCGAIPETLLESELFGHEKGAFTGALRKKLGKFELARGGTIFLDEIGTVSPASQVKLLQVLQDGTFSRVGGEEVITTDARIIAATNADLEQMSEQGRFRKDLYYRLNVFPIELPPLRDRIEDIPFLTRMFLNRLNQEHGKHIADIHPGIMAAFERYHWPGNIRELENLLERAYLLEATPQLTPESFPEELMRTDPTSAVVPIDTQTTLSCARKKATEDFERRYLKELFIRNRGKVKQAADEAGITTRQLNKLMLKYNIRKEDFKR
jgi:DNA-binding NtrC family response regulator